MRRATMAILAGVLFSMVAGTALAAPGEGDAATKGTGNLAVEKLDSGDYSDLQRRRFVVASSAADLSRVVGHKVPSAGKGTYLAACWGEKPTGGYSVRVASASKTGSGVSVSMRLRSPAPGAVTTQALTNPYTVVVVKDLDLRGKSFAFFASDGRRLDWPLKRVRE